MADSQKVFLACCGGFLASVFVLLIIIVGSMSVANFEINAYTATGVEQLAQVYDMGRDWDKKTFTDLKVIDEAGQPCERGWEDAYNRVYYGLQEACDCLGRYGRYLNTENQFVQGEVCDRNQTRYGCTQVKPFPAVYMHILDDKRICGHANGPRYRNAILPQLTAAGEPQCQEGYLPCIENQRNSFCIEKSVSREESCPITDIQFVQNSDTPQKTELESKGYKAITFDSEQQIYFSKTKDQLPVTSLKVGPKPCENPNYQANDSGKRFYPAEMMQNTKCKTDTRYTSSGFTTNERRLEEDNAILNVLKSRSSYQSYVFVDQKDNMNYQTWNRPTWSWKLECEAQGKTRQQAYEKTKLALSTSGHEEHVYNCGLAIVIMLPIICCCTCCAVFGIGPAGLAYPIFCSNFIWLIIGPIILTSLAEMQSAIERNIEVATEFSLFTDCADPLAQVDVEQLQSLNLKTLEAVFQVRFMSIAIFTLMAMVCLCPCLCLMCFASCNAMQEAGCSCRSYVEWSDLLEFWRLMKKG